MNFSNEIQMHNNISSTRIASSLDNSELQDSYSALQFESQPTSQGILQGEQEGPDYRVSSSSKVNFSKLLETEKIIRLKNMAKEIKALKKKLRLMKARKLTKYESNVSLPQIQDIIKTYEKSNQIIGMSQSSLQFKISTYRNDLFDKVVEYSTFENQNTAQFQTTSGSQQNVQVSTQQILNLKDNQKVQMKFQEICSQLQSQKPHFSGKTNIDFKNKEGNQNNKQIFKIVKILNKQY
eukprot:403355387